MAKPAVTLRETKGSVLSYAELDTNFTNLRDATISIDADGTVVALDLNDTVTLTAGSNVTLTTVGNEITIAVATGAGYGIALTDLSVTDAGGDGSLTYNNTTGVFTYTGPSAAEVRSHFSAGTGISISSGVISSTITQYTDEAVDDRVNGLLTAGTGISLVYDDGANTLTISASGSSQLTGDLDVNGYKIKDTTGSTVTIEEDLVVGNSGVFKISDIVGSNRIECTGNLIIGAELSTFGGSIDGPSINMSTGVNGGSIIIGTNSDPDDRVSITDVLNINSLTSTEITNLTAPLNGDIVYNSTTNKFQGRANGSWVDLH